MARSIIIPLIGLILSCGVLINGCLNHTQLSLIRAITAGEYGEAHALYGRKDRGYGDCHE